MNYELRIKKHKNTGYTIIETMIAVSLFIVIVMAGMGALLNANLLHKKSQNMRSIMDNLSFIMEEMSKNLRTGYDYRCINGGNFSYDITIPQSCVNGKAIAFESAHGNNDPLDSASPLDQWVYKIDEDTNNIFKSVNSGVNWTQLNPSEIIIDRASSFSVLGAESPSSSASDKQQPFVVIRLVGKIRYKDIDTPFSLQTSVSQRNIDI
ncbi:MAG: hypothetical protein WCP17_03685 [bacterium]